MYSIFITLYPLKYPQYVLAISLPTMFNISYKQLNHSILIIVLLFTINIDHTNHLYLFLITCDHVMADLPSEHC